MSRVRPNALIVFKPNNDSDNTEDASDDKPTVLSSMISGFKEDGSIFSWADTGAWETVDMTDDDLRRDGNWFRIGFEPIFVDFTQKGSWFALVTLLEV